MRLRWRWMALAVSLPAFGCASGGADMVLPKPGPVPFKADFSGVTLALQSLHLTAVGAPRSAAVPDRLRGALGEYLRGYVGFRDVIVEAQPKLTTDDAMLNLDVEIEAAQRTGPASLLQREVGPNLFSALAPQWGEVTVRVAGTVSNPQGEVLWTGEDTGHAEYEKVLFEGYHGRSVEAAYSAAYGEAFGRFATQLGGAHASLSSRRDRAHQPLAGSLTPASPAFKIAVMATQLDGTSANKLPNVFEDCVLSAVQQASGAETMGQDDINTLLSYERQKDLLGCDDATCVAALAGALGADLVVTVRVARLAPDWAFSAKIISVRNPRVESRIAEFAGGDVEALMRAVPAMMQKLFDQRRR